jgi:hypothetical protein
MLAFYYNVFWFYKCEIKMLKGLMIAAITITLVITTIVLNNDFDYIQHGDAKFVYDTTSVNDEMAQTIHQFLLDKNSYQGQTGELFLLKQTETGKWLVKFPVYQGGDLAPQLMRELEVFAKDLQKQVLNGAPLEVHITNAGYQGVQYFEV